MPRAGLVWRCPGPLFAFFWLVIFCQKQWYEQYFSVCGGFVEYDPIYFGENRSRGCSVVSSFRILVDYVVEIRKAATRSRFSEFLLGLCKAGHVLQPSGGEH